MKELLNELKKKMEKHSGLSIFASERSKFEGWLKVEVIDTLLKQGKDVKPEVNFIDVVYDDVVFDNVAIELKVINTTYPDDNAPSKSSRRITINTQSVIKDIDKLKKKGYNYGNGYVLFVTFPVTLKNKYWHVQYKRIKKHLSKIDKKRFIFKNGVHGVIYLGKI